MEQDNDNHRDQLEKEYWEPVGRFIFAFGDLERLVDEFLIDLLGIDYRIAGKFTLSEIDFLARANLLKAFCRGTAVEKEMKEVVTEIEQLNTFRNRLIHGTWSAHFESTEGNTHFHKIGVSRQHRVHTFNFSVGDIQNNRMKLEALKKRLGAAALHVLAQRVDADCK